MATIQNDRDILLQAAAIRVVPVPIPISQVTGLAGALGDINTTLSTQNSQINSALNNTKDLLITASSTVFSGSSAGTTPSTITLNAVLKNGLTGTVTWSVTAGNITLSPSGNTCVLTGTSMLSQSVTIRARLVSGNTYDAFVTIAGLGVLAAQNTVDLTSQVTGQLAAGNTTGFGALALLNTVDLNTQTTGALNGLTQVNNLGTLAYANAIAANQIGAGTLAAGVIYAGTVNVENLVGTTISGKTLSGTTAVYVQGTNTSAPVAMYVSGGTVGVLRVNGLLDVNKSSGVSTFNVSNSGNISGGSISGGTTTDIRGTFTVRSTNISYANIESTSTYLRFRTDACNFISASGAGIMEFAPGRVTIQTPFLNLASITSDPGGSIQGDMALYNNEVVIRISGAWYKLTKTPL